ncbi:serine hydrolase [Sulfuriflexus mobilis]|uniref:serine hydrolase n=1 Tax=Sulfuriflexus mobilis TaxID=1811807 RepID=UPI001E5372F1|nr:serine hydrolase [Sulfuriflexus mobilis]
MRKLSIALLLAAFIAAPAIAGRSQPPRLADNKDARLQKKLEHVLAELGLNQAARQSRLAVALVDITDEQHPRLASINGRNMMYAASLPKIAILLGAFARIERGDMQLDEKTRATLVKMIRYSSNRAATEMLNRVGKQFLTDLLQSPRYALYDKDHDGGLWVGKEYGKGSAFKRDPLHHLSHGANVFQVARFYYLLETDRLVSPELSREMKAILSKPGINHKFVKGLSANRPGSTIYRKSGSWRQWHADSAIVERDGRRYIAVALANDSKGGRWMEKLIVAMDDLVMQPESGSNRVAALD